MPCYHPLQAYQPTEGAQLIFTKEYLPGCKSLQVPCGQCIGCRLKYSQMWAIRIMHEASLHDSNCFVTLTYADEHLPSDFSLNVKHYQDFMKRLRKKFGNGIRFYHCGEYGEKYGRPHYHAAIFGFDFPDKYLLKVENGNRLYRSAALEQLWPFGHSSIGTLTFDSAAYIARYMLKKHKGKNSKSFYESIDFDSGELVKRKPEYCTMSRKPGIAHDWYQRFKDDVYKDDTVIFKGRPIQPPRYYDSLYELDAPLHMKEVKQDRVDSAERRVSDDTPKRMAIRERNKLRSMKDLPRKLDGEL